MTKEELEATRAKFRETMERQRAAAMASTEAPPPPATQPKPKPSAASPTRIARPSIRLIEEDLSKVREAMAFALTMNESLNTTEVLRIALHDWDFKKLTPKKIVDIRAQDGRRKGPGS